ncbi:MAG: class II fructose-bisphosphate aldolase [Hyphomicrobiales bacterium]
MTKLKPGVVTGEEYVALVEACKSGGYALPAVNVSDVNSTNAALEAAAMTKSDIIIQLSNGGAGFYGGPSIGTTEMKVKGAVSAARHVHMMAEDYGVAVILHTDHANRKLLPWIDGMMDYNEATKKETGKPLYSSHMIDLSEEELDDNIGTCADYLKRMAQCDISLEIELGVTGGEEDGVGHDLEEGADSAHLYTQPEDVLQAYDVLKDLGHFTVAASFGNVHGVYKPGNVQLRPEILINSQKLVEAERGTGSLPLHLVFHGGSGSEKEKIAEALSYGVFKMNIDTDTQFACAQGVGNYMDSHPVAFKHQIDPDSGAPQKKFYDPRKWNREVQKSMAARLEEAFHDLQSHGRSVCN